ncbi:hypothetical protein MIND_01001800 [Mycena indigotica]|uniref:Uncharacterized protein n=1 Tax=Mycena indigotica TaxID=2126181 RepID=A0A8H6S7V8_9AGAR|nr:uncharacterized protein MIND_01001800 [Mycena indigotica]KAF7294650.1 hypothetical protein MIND_01001800 [Mycena indigotica]
MCVANESSPTTRHKRSVLEAMIITTLLHELAHTWLRHILADTLTPQEMKVWETPENHPYDPIGESGHQLESYLLQGTLYCCWDDDDTFLIDRFHRIIDLYFQTNGAEHFYAITWSGLESFSLNLHSTPMTTSLTEVMQTLGAAIDSSEQLSKSVARTSGLSLQRVGNYDPQSQLQSMPLVDISPYPAIHDHLAFTGPTRGCGMRVEDRGELC